MRNAVTRDSAGRVEIIVVKRLRAARVFVSFQYQTLYWLRSLVLTQAFKVNVARLALGAAVAYLFLTGACQRLVRGGRW